MPSLEDMRMVGETCSEYDPEADEELDRSCASCLHWEGEARACGLDIFWEQLTSLDQT